VQKQPKETKSATWTVRISVTSCCIIGLLLGGVATGGISVYIYPPIKNQSTLQIFRWLMVTGCFLARLANLPEGLYILPIFFLYFF